MKNTLLLTVILILVSVASYSQDIVGSLTFAYDDQIITDNRAVFSFRVFNDYVTAWDVQTGVARTISLPKLQNTRDMTIQYANSLPDGYLIVANYVKSSRDDAKGKTVSGIFFYDRDGKYKDMFDLPDRRFIAAAPWDDQNIAVSWFKIASQAQERYIITDLTIVDRKGHWVADLQPQVFYEVLPFQDKYAYTWSKSRLYWQGNTLMAVDPNASEVVYFDKNKVVLKRLKGNTDIVPGTAKKFMAGSFKAAGKDIALLDSIQSPGGLTRYWVDLSQPDIPNPRNIKAADVHIIGDRAYLAKPTPAGKALFLINDDNWMSLLQ